MPYTEALLNSIPKLTQPSHTRLEAIGGRPPDLINPPKGCRFSPRCPYAQDKCVEEDPPTIEADTPGHLFKCWFPVGTPGNKEALDVNLARGETATGTPVSAEGGRPRPPHRAVAELA